MNMKKIAAMISAFLAVVMVLGLMLGLLAGVVSAASSGEIQNQIDRLEQEQDKLQADVSAVGNCHDAHGAAEHTEKHAAPGAGSTESKTLSVLPFFLF